MDVIKLDGNGRPTDDATSDGDILLLVQAGTVSVVQLELLPADAHGPCLHHAVNDADLAREAIDLVRAENPESLSSPDDTTLRCPEGLAAQALFSR